MIIMTIREEEIQLRLTLKFQYAQLVLHWSSIKAPQTHFPTIQCHHLSIELAKQFLLWNKLHNCACGGAP